MAIALNRYSLICFFFAWLESCWLFETSWWISKEVWKGRKCFRSQMSMTKVRRFANLRDFKTLKQHESCLRKRTDWDRKCLKSSVSWILNSLGQLYARLRSHSVFVIRKIERKTLKRDGRNERKNMKRVQNQIKTFKRPPWEKEKDQAFNGYEEVWWSWKAIETNWWVRTVWMRQSRRWTENNFRKEWRKTLSCLVKGVIRTFEMNSKR